MRTTVDIPDPIYRRLKSVAALQGCSIKELVLRGITRELEEPRNDRKPLLSKLALEEGAAELC